MIKYSTLENVTNEVLFGTRKIETERLILRRFVMEDAEDMYNNWASDPEVTKYLTWPTHPSSEVTKDINGLDFKI